LTPPGRVSHGRLDASTIMSNKKKQKQAGEPVESHGRRGLPPLGRRTLVVLLAILAAGLVLRASYLVELKQLPDFDHPLVDSHYHDYWARAMVADQWFPPEHEPDPQINSTPYFRPPGYPYFLAAIYTVFGHGYVAPRVIQMLLGLAGILLLFVLGRRLFDDRTGLVAAGLMAIYWIFVYFEGEFLEPVLSVPLLLAFVLALLTWGDRPSALTAIVAGVLLGLLALVRPNALVLIPLAGAWIYWVGRSAVQNTHTLRTIALLLAGAFAVILPVTIRNKVVSGDVVLISSNAGINLLIGNSARADGEVRGTIPGIGALDTSFDYPYIVERVEQLEGRPMTHAEVGRYLASRALREMAADPGRTVGLMLRKTLLFWGPDEVADNKVIALDRSHSAVLRWIPLSFAVVFSLGIVGLALAWRRRQNARQPQAATTGIILILVVVLVWFASHLPIAVTARYRVPVIPFLILFAAFFLRWVVTALKQRRARDAAPWLIALIVLLVVSHVNIAGYEDNVARWHYQRAIAFQHGGDLDGAIGEYQAALRENPDYGAVYNDIAAALATKGRMAESVPHFQRAIHFNPDDPSVHLNLAMALESLGRRQESNAQYREVLRLSPDNPDAQAGLQRTTNPDDNQ
jgi:4-amino-4-deoxy-L-arabinose transferase-like glycosyltransferase